MKFDERTIRVRVHDQENCDIRLVDGVIEGACSDWDWECPNIRHNYKGGSHGACPVESQGEWVPHEKHLFVDGNQIVMCEGTGDWCPNCQGQHNMDIVMRDWYHDGPPSYCDFCCDAEGNERPREDWGWK